MKKYAKHVQHSLNILIHRIFLYENINKQINDTKHESNKTIHKITILTEFLFIIMLNDFRACIIDEFKVTDICKPWLTEFPKFLELPPEIILKIISYVGTIYRERKKDEVYEMIEKCKDIIHLSADDQLKLGYLELKRKDQINLIDVLTGYTGMYSRYETNTLTEEDLEMLKQFISPNFRPFSISYLEYCELNLRIEKRMHNVSIFADRRIIHEHYRKYIPTLIIPKWTDTEEYDKVCMYMEHRYIRFYVTYEYILNRIRRDPLLLTGDYLSREINKSFNYIMNGEGKIVTDEKICKTCAALFEHE